MRLKRNKLFLSNLTTSQKNSRKFRGVQKHAALNKVKFTISNTRLPGLQRSRKTGVIKRKINQLKPTQNRHRGHNKQKDCKTIIYFSYIPCGQHLSRNTEDRGKDPHIISRDETTSLEMKRYTRVD